MVDKDLYRLLGVPPTASADRIRSAYRKGVRQYHPDVYKGDPEVAKVNFRALTEAYETLSDPERRKEYDREREEERARPGPRAPHDRSGPPRAVTISRRPAGWLHYPPPEPPWTRAANSQDPATRRIAREWKAARQRSLPELMLPRRLRTLLVLVFVVFLAVLAGLLTIPVSQAFSFTGSPTCFTQSSANTYQFEAGDHVAFSWVTPSESYDRSLGGTPPGITLESSHSGTVMVSQSWNGSYSYVADGSSYTFYTMSCSLVVSEVQFSGDFVGPLL